MDEPERILNQTNSALERALLQEGRAYRGKDELRDHTLAALGLAGSAGLAGGLLAWLLSRSWATKLILALSTATLLVAIPVSYVVFGRSAGPPRAVPGVPTAAPLPAPAPPVPASPAPAIAIPQPTGPSPTAAPAVVPAAPARAQATASSALRAELAALDAVRSTLANDDPAGALTFLGAYFRTFPRGRLHLEAEVLRIDALAKAGQVEDARRHAQDFLKRHPNSVLTARVRPYAEH